MSQKFSKLFEPITIGKLTIKNRIAMAPMFILKMTNPDGSPTQRALDFYIERARGGVGLIIAGAHKVENTTEVANVGFPFISPEVMTPFGELCDTLHSLGTRFIVQCTAGMGRVGKFVDNIPVSASAVPHQWRPDIMCRPLEIKEVENIVEAFGQAAEVLVAAGVDGMELHGHEGYIFDQFATPLWNKRTDKYGGSLEARLRFPVEALQKIRQRAGKNFHVQYRYGLKHFLKGPYKGGVPGEVFEEVGRDIEEGIAMAKIFEQAGFNTLHIDAGAKSCPYWGHPAIYQEHGCLTDLAAQVKKAVKIPVITVGRINTPELAERIIAEGKADLIAMARGFLADPYWPMKVREGKEEEIRPCIACGDGCTGRVNHAKPMSCAVNPACGRERVYELAPAEKSKKLMVVGGGIAGMEIARVAATRGHRVKLFEKGEALGGHLIEAAVPDFKRDVRRLLKWYERQLSKLEVEIKFRTEVTKSLVGKEKPDAICVATGSKPVIPDLPGIKKSHVMTCIDALLGKGKIGSEVAVIGGGLIGCETALWLAQQGKKVTILEMLPQLMSTRYHPDYNRVMLIDLLEHLRVTVLTGVRVQEITDVGVILLDPEGQRREVKADTVILAVGLKPDDTLYKLLAREAAEVHGIGDCQEPVNVMKAIWDAYEVGRCI